MALPVNDWMKSGNEEDHTAFDHLFASEYRRVVNIAFRVLGDAHQSEDVAQEVFLSFYRRHDPAAPYAAAWLHRAASHVALNTVREHKRRARRERREGLSPAGQTAATEIDPQDAATVGEQRREVRQVLGRLPARSAEVLILRHSGLSYSEVAAALGCGVGQVGTLLRRAEAAFKKEIEQGND
jgi:RNA polymerase sigma-70 factor (ECF subfamily)